MAMLHYWVRNKQSGEVTAYTAINALPYLFGENEFVSEADYIAYQKMYEKLPAVLKVAKRKFQRISKG